MFSLRWPGPLPIRYPSAARRMTFIIESIIYYKSNLFILKYLANSVFSINESYLSQISWQISILKKSSRLA